MLRVDELTGPLMSSIRALSWRLPLAILVLAGLTHPRVVHAQRPISMLSDSMTALYGGRNLPLTWRPTLPCSAALSVVPTHRVSAFLSASTGDTNDRLQISQANEMARDVVREIRKALGAVADSIADGSALSWRSLPTRLTVTGYADGHVARSALGPSSDSSASRLLLKAFDDARQHGTAKMPWLNDKSGEPVLVWLWLEPPDVDSAGKSPPPDADDPAFTAFSFLAPTRSSLREITTDKLRYPRSNAKNGVEGEVYLRFVVDTNGNVDSATVHDVRPTIKSAERAPSAEEYRDFVDATKKWIVGRKFWPAKVGSCHIETVEEQRVVFRAP